MRRYVPPPRPKQPSAADQAQARMTAAVQQAMQDHIKAMFVEDTRKVNVRCWEASDRYALATAALCAALSAYDDEQKREQLDDEIPDLA